MSAVANIQAAQTFLSQAAPELLATLHRHHDTFRAMLQVNLTVLATAHAVSEGIVRGVNAEIQRRNIPNTYTAAGQRAAPGPRNITPLAVSRSLELTGPCIFLKLSWAAFSAIFNAFPNSHVERCFI